MSACMYKDECVCGFIETLSRFRDALNEIAFCSLIDIFPKKNYFIFYYNVFLTLMSCMCFRGVFCHECMLFKTLKDMAAIS